METGNTSASKRTLENPEEDGSEPSSKAARCEGRVPTTKRNNESDNIASNANIASLTTTLLSPRNQYVSDEEIAVPTSYKDITLGYVKECFSKSGSIENYSWKKEQNNHYIVRPNKPISINCVDINSGEYSSCHCYNGTLDVMSIHNHCVEIGKHDNKGLPTEGVRILKKELQYGYFSNQKLLDELEKGFYQVFLKKGYRITDNTYECGTFRHRELHGRGIKIIKIAEHKYAVWLGEFIMGKLDGDDCSITIINNSDKLTYFGKIYEHTPSTHYIEYPNAFSTNSTQKIICKQVDSEDCAVILNDVEIHKGIVIRGAPYKK